MGEVQVRQGKILVIGHRGMLGRAVMGRLGERAVGGDLPECDMTRSEQVRALIEAERPGAILNCAAWTDVDGAEAHEAAARRLNAEAVEGLGRLAREAGLHLVTISTDYVFSGEGTEPWPEDAPETAYAPQSAYGRTKLEGEQRLREVGGDWCIARTQWLYGAGGKNFVETIARLSTEKDVLQVVDDQIGGPTWTEDLAGALEVLLDSRATGIYHCVNSGYVSWCGLARRVVERLGRPCRVEPCMSDKYPRPARRPFNSRLEQGKYAALASGPMRHWEAALDAYLAGRVE
jgi:dTDP-4-dehydrorhamnose reductase